MSRNIDVKIFTFANFYKCTILKAVTERKLIKEVPWSSEEIYVQK